MPSIDPWTVANLDPEDGSSHVDAIRTLAEAVAELQQQVLTLQADVMDLETKVG